MDPKQVQASKDNPKRPRSPHVSLSDNITCTRNETCTSEQTKPRKLAPYTLCLIAREKNGEVAQNEVFGVLAAG